MTHRDSVDPPLFGSTSYIDWDLGPQLSPDDRAQIVELAGQLPRLAALATYVNSDKCTDRDRQRLRELVPASTYFQLLCSLADLRSGLARRIRCTTGRSNQVVVDLVTFFDAYAETPDIR